MDVRARAPRILAGTAVAVLAGTTAVAAGPALAQSPPGLIAYSSGLVVNDPDVFDPSQVYTVRPDGTHERQLTHVPDGKQAGGPAISPDGAHIVYSSNQRGDNFSLWEMDADGRHQHRLFGKRGYDLLQPRWSPDGSRLVFTRCDTRFGFTSACAIVTRNLDGTDQRVLFDQHRRSGDATFSPDGQWVAFDSDAGGYISAIWKVRATGGSPVRLTDPLLQAFWPDWSPDGSRLAFASNLNKPASQIFTMTADGTDLHQLTHTTEGGGAADPSYSPDGSQIAFDSDQANPGGPAEIHVVDVDGTDEHTITTSTPAFLPDWSGEAN